MKPIIAICLLFSAVRLLGAAAETGLERLVPVPATEPVPAIDFFRPPLLHSPQVNPAGTHLAALVNNAEDRRDLLVHDLEKKTSTVIAGSREQDVYAFSWLTDRRIVYHVSTEKLYALAMLAVDIDKPNLSHALLQYCSPALIGVPERNRLKPLVWMRVDSLSGLTVEGSGKVRTGRVAEIDTNVNTGPFQNLRLAGTQLEHVQTVKKSNDRHVDRTYPEPEGGTVVRYLADREGELAFAFTSRDGVFTLHRYAGSKWLKSPVNPEVNDVLSPGDRPDEILVRPPRQEGKPRALKLMNAVTGGIVHELLQDKAYDFIGGVYRDPATREIVGAYYNRTGPTMVWFNEEYRQIQKLLDASFPDQLVRIIGGDKTGRLLVLTSSDRHPGSYHWVDLAKRTMGLIKNSAPWIDPARMQPMSMIAFKTRDGHRLDAYVTLPAGASKEKPAPLVVLPHGGPWARDTWGYNGQVQFLASRGYAVMQPNYRGSPGYGWMFPDGDEFDFRKMHEDVTDATKALIASGYVDPRRVAIMGASFGAYLALMGAVNEPGLYRCAVTIAGVFDWERVMGDLKDHELGDSYARMRRRLGDPQKEKEKYDAISPVRHVDQVRIPVFVAHGKEDPVASLRESRELIDELEKYRVPHEVLLVSAEGHGMARVGNRLELYTRAEAFLAKHLTADPRTE